MRRRQTYVLCWIYCLYLVAFSQAAQAFQTTDQTIVIPKLDGATIDSQESDSIEFLLPAGKGKLAIKDWLAKFRMEGWNITVIDQDGMWAEYELSRRSQTLEIELDDPGIDEAEIAISCDSDFRMEIEGAPAKAALSGPVVAPVIATLPSQANARQGETSLGSVAGLEWEIEEGWPSQWWVSPDGRRFACRKSTQDGPTIAVDGADMGKWDTIDSELLFSPDSRHHAFIAGRDEAGKSWQYLVVDGVPGKPVEQMDDEFTFSADSSQVIFGRKHTDGTKVLIRPVEPSLPVIEPGYRFAAYQDFFFHGPDGGVGYLAAFSDREKALFWNGRQIGERYADIASEHVAVSAGGQHIAFFAEISPVRLGLVVDGKIVREHNQFDQGTVIEDTLTISPNGKRVAWGSRLNSQEFMYVDGKSEAGYESLGFPVFSKDSKRFAYIAMKEGSPLTVIDGMESERYAMASEVEFTSDGRTSAYYAELSQKQFVVVNGKRQSEFDDVTTPLMNEDGSIVAYSAQLGEIDVMIVNGEVISTQAVLGSPYFVPGSNTLAWLAFNESQGWRIFVDGSERFAFDDFAGTPVFSPDGQHIAIVTLGEHGASLTIDGKSGAVYDRIVAHDRDHVRFDEAGDCYYLAVRNDELFLVKSKISK